MTPPLDEQAEVKVEEPAYRITDKGRALHRYMNSKANVSLADWSAGFDAALESAACRELVEAADLASQMLLVCDVPTSGQLGLRLRAAIDKYKGKG